MKKYLLVCIALCLLAATSCKTETQKVMARYVPERADDFVWENDRIIYRAYGTALENETLSPGFDVWVKMPGKLVADEWYKGAMTDPNFYHFNRGDGKDCYKVAKSLGGGASAPLINDSVLVFPTHNYATYEILKSTPTEASFVFYYPEWPIDSLHKVSLAKKITIKAGTNFCEVEDTYKGNFDQLQIAAGIIRHKIHEEISGPDHFAFWEEASDQSLEPEDGMLGLALYMPRADKVVLNGPANHSIAIKTIKPGDTVLYYFGSCWSKSTIDTPAKWFEMVKSFK